MTKEEKREYDRRRYQASKEKIAARIAEYYQVNKEEVAVQKAEYRATPIGRAVNLLSGYRQSDKKHNRGECTLTPQWIVDNIFNKPCHYCGESDWHKIGCDRIDNSKPHTEDNVVLVAVSVISRGKQWNITNLKN